MWRIPLAGLCVALAAPAIVDDGLSRAWQSSFMPKLQAQYAFGNDSHTFWITLAWDFDEIFSSDRLLSAMQIQNLKREQIAFLQQQEN